MMNFKKLIVVATVVGLLGAAGAAYATTAKTPAEITAFKTQVLEQKKIILDQRVDDGRLTQEQADNIYNTIQSHHATCDGTGNAGIGKNYGAGFGQGNGMGNGNGSCDGTGIGYGNGSGMKNGTGMGFGRGLNR